ncbi:NAD-dependent epimerase/dehydratase family protein [Lactococcus lactis]|uniref:NAD-dependent epimerase/dehydratase family protein n=1 Tax=Lactococcus lactis TaxID=1358 RepID=UPI00112194AB|nr:NAD(P)-dependent oxidoreductase [Lactococcus lactis]TNU78170.1 NAD(P)-dependent oxidoreductase [Lactococcus lactis subsp. lactis]
MKVFITGATGKVGSRFALDLLEKGIEVYVLVRDLNRAQFLKDKGAKLVEGDLTNKDLLIEAIRGKDVVVHLAAQFRGVSEEQAWTTNVEGTEVLAKATLSAGVKRFVFSSTSLVYMNEERTHPITENETIKPIAIYPKSKAESEKFLKDLRDNDGLDLRILRFAFVYGDGDEHLTEFSPVMSKWEPKQRLSMAHHKDITNALYLACITPEVKTGVYNVAGQIPSTVDELLKYLNVTPTNDDVLSFSEYEMVLDVSAIEKELGFIARYPSFDNAIKAEAL